MSPVGEAIALALLFGEVGVEFGHLVAHATPRVQPVGIDRARLDHRAVRFVVVEAVGESALRGQVLDLGERERQPVPRLPEGEGAHAGGVEEEPTVAQHDEPRGGGRVAAFAIALADLPLELDLLAGKRVHQRRLADPGTAEQREGSSRANDLMKAIEPFSGAIRHGHDLDVRGGASRLVQCFGDRVGIDQVGLGDHHDRGCSALVGEDQFALEAAKVQPRVEGLYDQHHVHVGGEGLRGERAASGAPHERGEARSDGFHPGLFEVDDDPVSGHAILRRGGRRCPNDIIGVRPEGHVYLAAVDANDPPSRKCVVGRGAGRQRRDSIGDVVIPADADEAIGGGHRRRGVAGVGNAMAFPS